MPEQNENNILQQLIEQDPMVKSGVKKLQKSQDEDIDQAIQAGVPYQDILKQLIQLSSVKMPIAGTMKGPSAIMDLLQGQGFNPLAPHEKQLGLETAAKIMALGQAAEKMPYEMASTQADLLKKVMELTGINPISGKNISDIEAETAAKKETATVRARKEEESKIRTEEFAQELNNYFEIGDLLPTSEGLGRFVTGAKLFGKSITQSDVEGALAADLGRINKRIRVKLVRQAGDVGNLNRAITDKSESSVRKVISEYVNTSDFKNKNPELYEKYTKSRSVESSQSKYTEGQTATNPKTGEQLIFRGGKWQTK